MPRKSQLPSHVPVGELAALSGESARTIQQWALKGLIPKPENREGGYRLMESLAKIREIRNARDEGAEEEKQWKRQQVKAEAESAMVKLAKDRGELMLTEDAGRLWDDGLTQIKVIIRGASYIKEAQRDQVLADIASVKLSE